MAKQKFIEKIGTALKIFSAEKSPMSEILSDVNVLRARLEETFLEITHIENSPCDLETVSARVDAIVASLALSARKFLPDLNHESFDALEVAHSFSAKPKVLPTSAGYVNLDAPVPTTWQMLALSDPDRLKAILLENVGDAAERRFTQQERADAVQTLLDEQQNLMGMEERLIRNAERAGFNIARRPDAEPQYLLAYDSELS